MKKVGKTTRPFQYDLNQIPNDYSGFPLAQLVKNPPAMQETPVGFLGQEDLLKKG